MQEKKSTRMKLLELAAHLSSIFECYTTTRTVANGLSLCHDKNRHRRAKKSSENTDNRIPWVLDFFQVWEAVHCDIVILFLLGPVLGRLKVVYGLTMGANLKIVLFPQHLGSVLLKYLLVIECR